MAIDFKLPDLGEGVHEGQIIRVHVQAGQRVEEDQPLLEVETDKAAVDIPSPRSGIVEAVHVAEDQVVNVGDVMITFGSDDADVPVATAAAAAATASPTDAGNGQASIVRPENRRRPPASPAVRKFARQRGIDLADVTGSGPAGRITRADVEAVASGAPPAETDASPTPAPASPAAPAAPTYHAPPVELPGTPDRDAWGDITRASLSRPRMTIARTMTQAWTTIPHVTDCDDADVTELDRLRRRYNDSRGPDRPRLSLLPFVLRAVAAALRMHPIFNASFDAEQDTIIYRKSIHLALGVQTDRGLIAPVIRDADQRTVTGLHDEVARLTARVRSGSFDVNETRGGTFTVSNAGAMGGSRYATPIVTPGQVAVLVVGRSRKLPWVVDDEVVPRLIMPLSISFDHRIIDGAEEIAFQQTIIRHLEQPVALM